MTLFRVMRMVSFCRYGPHLVKRIAPIENGVGKDMTV